jgi:hypothetical protein
MTCFTATSAGTQLRSVRALSHVFMRRMLLTQKICRRPVQRNVRSLTHLRSPRLTVCAAARLLGTVLLGISPKSSAGDGSTVSCFPRAFIPLSMIHRDQPRHFRRPLVPHRMPLLCVAFAFLTPPAALLPPGDARHHHPHPQGAGAAQGDGQRPHLRRARAGARAARPAVEGLARAPDQVPVHGADHVLLGAVVSARGRVVKNGGLMGGSNGFTFGIICECIHRRL